MSDDEASRHLRRLLSELKASEELERFAAQRREANRLAGAVRAEALHTEVVFPSLRAFAAELEREGHMTRVERVTPKLARLHLQLQGKRAIGALVEVDWRLEGDPRLRIRLRYQYRDLDLEELPAVDVDSERVARVWVRILERLVRLANR